MIKVLFVCLGNICRSPMADGVFQQIVNDAGLSDHIMIDSAGTSRYHIGDTAHRGTLEILSTHGIDYHGRARQMLQNDLKRFDYVLAMDKQNLSAIQSMIPLDDKIAEISLFLQYAYDAGQVDVLEVPDPYYDNRFQEVYDLVRSGCDILLNHIRTQHRL